MKETRDEIITLADELITHRGYNAFSYSDISKALSIKNSSVHYHFPAKSDLGIAVIQRAIDSFMNTSDTCGHLSYKVQLAKIVSIYSKKKENDTVCLMGALSADYQTLSPEMQERLELLGSSMFKKLIEILGKGKKAMEFDFIETPEAKASLIQSSLISSLLLNRVLKNDSFHLIEQELLSI